MESLEHGSSTIRTATASMLMETGSWVGLVFSACEWLCSLQFEFRNVWKNSDSPLHLRVIYLASRYTGLLGQALYLAVFNYLRRVITVSRPICGLYWFSQLLFGVIGLLLLQIVLSKRAFALWNYDNRIGALLLILFVLDSGAAALFGGIASFQMNFKGRCLPDQDRIPKEIIYLCSTEIIVQIVLWTLIFIKCVSFRREHITSLSLLTHVKRESFLILIFACVVPLSVIADGVWTRLATEMTTKTYLAFPIFLSTITSATCRTIANTIKISEKISLERNRPDEALVFTSIDLSANNSSPVREGIDN